MQNNEIDLSTLSHVSDLFKIFTSGKHLNRLADASLWYELEQYINDYKLLFTSLGYELKIDGRGFAWFDEEDASRSVNKQSRNLALLFMVLFDFQADQGKSLGNFFEWIIDKDLLKLIYVKNQSLLDAEELDLESLSRVMEKAVRNGFAIQEQNHWRLLPAVYRYLDHFESLIEQQEDNSLFDIEERV